MLKNKHFEARNKQGKGKVQLNNACRDIELYSTSWKQASWSIITDMSWHPKESKDDQTVTCCDVRLHAMTLKHRRI